MESVCVGTGEDHKVAAMTVANFCKKLDPTNSGSVELNSFLKLGKERTELITFLVGKPLLKFENESLILNVNDDHLNEQTAAVFRLIRQGTVATIDKLQALAEKS